MEDRFSHKHTTLLPSIDANERESVEMAMTTFAKKYEFNNASSYLQVITEFESNEDAWTKIVPFMRDCTPFVQAVLTYANAISHQKSLDLLKRLVNVIERFESYSLSNLGHLSTLYLNLGIAWYSLGTNYETDAVSAFKKYIYYLLGLSSHEIYSPICYSFRKVSEHLYQYLINEEINLSSPTTFNDPFDSPIIGILDPKDKLASLIKKSYLECVKIGCYVCNTKQPYISNAGQPVVDEQKSGTVCHEYENELMWAHYADSHKGICIKYHFPSTLTSLHCRPDKAVLYFRDIEYREDLSVLNVSDSMSVRDAFFAKSKSWQYENEIRLLQCNINGNGDYAQISVSGCIEAVYFGARCPQKTQQTIMALLKGKMFNGSKSNGQVDVSPIKFFKMQYDKFKFGKLLATPIDSDNL